MSEHVRITVESLELEGVDVREPARVQHAFAAELTRLVRERGLDQARASRAGIEAGTLTEHDVRDPERLGRAVARLVYEELAR